MKAQARHILVKTADEAEKLKQRIANGEAFDVLARKFSTCRQASAVATWVKCALVSWWVPSTR